MILPAGSTLTGEPCQRECHQDGAVMMHAFPCCYLPNRDREMRTTDNCSMPGPGDIREREPFPRQPLTEADAKAIRDRMLWGESQEYLNLFVARGDPRPNPDKETRIWPPRDEDEFCRLFDEFVVRELIAESRL